MCARLTDGRSFATCSTAATSPSRSFVRLSPSSSVTSGIRKRRTTVATNSFRLVFSPRSHEREGSRESSCRASINVDESVFPRLAPVAKAERRVRSTSLGGVRRRVARDDHRRHCQLVIQRRHRMTGPLPSNLLRLGSYSISRWWITSSSVEGGTPISRRQAFYDDDERNRTCQNSAVRENRQEGRATEARHGLGSRRFPLGRLYVTPGTLALLEEIRGAGRPNSVQVAARSDDPMTLVLPYVQRHSSGDWGTLP